MPYQSLYSAVMGNSKLVYWLQSNQKLKYSLCVSLRVEHWSSVILDLPQVVLSSLSDEVGETSDEVARRRLVSPA